MKERLLIIGFFFILMNYSLFGQNSLNFKFHIIDSLTTNTKISGPHYDGEKNDSFIGKKSGYSRTYYIMNDSCYLYKIELTNSDRRIIRIFYTYNNHLIYSISQGIIDGLKFRIDFDINNNLISSVTTEGVTDNNYLKNEINETIEYINKLKTGHNSTHKGWRGL